VAGLGAAVDGVVDDRPPATLRPGVIDGSNEMVDVGRPVKVFVPVDVPVT